MVLREMPGLLSCREEIKMHKLLFLPGAMGDPYFWKPLGNLLPQEWEKIYFEWPGFGNQKSDPSVKCIDDLVSIVERSLDSTPADLFAQSMGGLIGARVAINNPGKVRRLVLTCTTAGGVNSLDYGAEDWRPDYRKEYPNAVPWISDRNLNFTNDLSKILQPTLLIWGDADSICPVLIGKELLKQIPDAGIEFISGGDHMFVRNRPEEIVEIIKKHLK